MMKKYRVTLNEEEIAILDDILNRGKHGAQKRKRARALLLAHENRKDSEIAEIVGMHYRGVEEIRRRFVEDGFE